MLTNEEIARRWDALDEGIKAQFTKSGQSIEEIRSRLVEVEQHLAQRGNRGGDVVQPQSVGATVTGSDGYKTFGGSMKRGKFTVPVNTITTGAGSAGALIVPDRRPDIVMLPQQRLVVRDLLTVSKTVGNSIEYPRQTVRTLNANVVTEGATKPESTIEFELKTVPVRTIAHWTKASKQALDDAPMLQSTIDSELRYGLGLKEEDEILGGDGTGQHLHGIIPQATDYNAILTGITNPNRFDILLDAIAQSEQALLPATGIVLNDIDLTNMRAIKDNDGNYIVSGGPFSGPITSIWGRPVAGTPAMSRGEFLVGAFRDGATVYDRWDAQVLVSTENEDDFIKNLCTILGEERLALAVKRPQAFIYGEFDTATAGA